MAPLRTKKPGKAGGRCARAPGSEARRKLGGGGEFLPAPRPRQKMAWAVPFSHEENILPFEIPWGENASLHLPCRFAQLATLQTVGKGVDISVFSTLMYPQVSLEDQPLNNGFRLVLPCRNARFTHQERTSCKSGTGKAPSTSSRVCSGFPSKLCRNN